MKPLSRKLAIALAMLQSANLAWADVPGAYIQPGSDYDIGVSTTYDFDQSFDDSYTFSPTTPIYLYQSRTSTDQASIRTKGRITVKQFPLDSSNKFPVLITVGGNNSPFTYDVTKSYAYKGSLKGPSGFDSRPIYLGEWIKSASFDIKYAGNAANPSTYLQYVFPDNQNQNATQIYNQTETISLTATANLSPDAGKSGVGGSVGYSKATTVGGTVSTQQMAITRSNSGNAGNSWTYTTQVDNNGHNITTPYDIFDNGVGLDTLKNAIPNIAQHFTPNLGQFWRIPKNNSVAFDVNLGLTTTAAAGVEAWSWGVNAGIAWKSYDSKSHTPYQSVISLDTSHPAIAGLNAYRFRYANNGQCWSAQTRVNLPALMKMQDCNTLVATQYFLQQADYTMANPSAVQATPWRTDVTGWWPLIVRQRNGQVECASYDATNCLWGQSVASIDDSRLKPLACGPAHQAKWGTDGYSQSGHWCARAQAANLGTGSGQQAEDTWFRDDSIYSGSPLRIHNGNIQCYAMGNNCRMATVAEVNADSNPSTLTCGKDHQAKWGGDGYSNSSHWCAKAAAKYLPASIQGESGDLYSKFYFTDNGTIKTNVGNYKVDAPTSGGYAQVKDVNTSNTRDGLWQYLVF